MKLINLIKGMIRRLDRLYSSVYTRYYVSGFKSCGKNVKIGLGFIGYCLDNVEVGDNFTCGERLKLRTYPHWGKNKYNPTIHIGNNVNVESDCHISAINSIIIEDNVLLASFVYISDHSHGDNNYKDLEIAPLKRPLFSKGFVKICKNVWIGEKTQYFPT